MNQFEEWKRRLRNTTPDQWRKPMKPFTLRSDPLAFDVQSNGCIQISRTDNGACIQFSQTEWGWIMRAAELMGVPHAPFISADNDQSLARDTLAEV